MKVILYVMYKCMTPSMHVKFEVYSKNGVVAVSIKKKSSNMDAKCKLYNSYMCIFIPLKHMLA